MSHHRSAVGLCRLKKQEGALGIDSSGPGQEPAAKSSGHGDEKSGSVCKKCVELADQLVTAQGGLSAAGS